MPIYEYQCQSCGSKLEVMQRIGDPPPGVCSKCGGDLRKLLSAPAFQFKGSGWYVTDYARKSDAKSGEKPASDAKSETKDAKSEPKDSKPETSTKSEPASKSTETAGKSSSDTSSSS